MSLSAHHTLKSAVHYQTSRLLLSQPCLNTLFHICDVTGAFNTPLQFEKHQTCYMRKACRMFVYFRIIAHERKTESTLNVEPDAMTLV